MGLFSKKFDQDEIAAVAAYYQQLRSGSVVIQTRQ
jgi:cytochrome c553